MPRRRPLDRRLVLRTSDALRWTFFALTLLPLPGVGAAVLGWRNPHTGLLPRGIAQALLVLFGSWPLVVPGVVGLAWAAWDAVRIGQARLLPLPPRNASPAMDAPAPIARPPDATRPVTRAPRR